MWKYPSSFLIKNFYPRFSATEFDVVYDNKRQPLARLCVVVFSNGLERRDNKRAD